MKKLQLIKRIFFAFFILGSFYLKAMNPSCTINVNLGNDTTICYGKTVVLNAKNSGSFYQWNTGATTRTITATSTGSYSVTVTDSYGCTGSDAINVTVLPRTTVNLGKDTIVCKSLVLNAGNTGMSYVWSTGATIQAITVTATGTYSVTVTNQNGCKATDAIYVTVLPNVTVNLGSDTIVACKGSFILNAGNPGMKFLWSSSATTQTITVTASGTYSVTVTSLYGCTASDAINVTILPKLMVNLGKDTTVCAPKCILLNAGNSGSSYIWSTGGTSQSITACSTGTYSVTVTNQSGCKATDAINVTVLPAITVSLGRDTIIACNGSFILNAGNPGMKFLWSTSATTQTITVTASGTYSVTVTNSAGCSASDAINVTILPKLMVNLGKDSTVCKSVVLNAGNTGMSYVWSTGATIQAITVTATGTYSVTVTNQNGCKATDAIYVTVLPNVTVNLGSDTIVACKGSFILNAGNAGMKFLWSTSATTQTITVTASGTYSVTVTNLYGCTASDAINVTILPKLMVNLGKDTTVCKSLILNAGNTGMSYIWSTGATTQTITVTATGTYSVTVTNQNGCKATDAIYVTVFPNVTVNLGHDTTIACKGSLILNAGNSGMKFLWSTSATTQTITVTASGTYSVTVTSLYGCTASDAINVTILPKLMVNLGKDTTVCAPKCITLNAGNSGSSYIWSTGVTAQSITACSTGTYSVTVTNQSGCKATDAINVTVLPAITVNLGRDTIIACNGFIILNAGNPGMKFLWSTSATTQTITVTATGTYSVTVTNSAGCSASDAIQIIVTPSPIVNLGKDTTVCAGKAVVLNAGNTGLHFVWSTGATTQTITVTATGTYSVTVFTNTQCSGTDAILVTILPKIVVNLGKDTTLCSTKCVTLNAGNTGGTYVWSTGASTQSITACSTGTYSVTVTNKNGCKGTDAINVTILPKIAVDLGKDTTIVCNGSLTLNAKNTGLMYKWSTGATTQTITVTATGTYSVVVTNQYGCTGSDNIYVTVTPSLLVNLGKDTTVCVGETVALNAGNPGLNFSWNTGATTQTITVTATGTYSVTVSTNTQCVGTDAINVTVLPKVVVNLGKDTTLNTCKNETITLNAGNPGMLYMWNTGATTQTITVSATGTYSVTVKSISGCTGTDKINVTIINNTIDIDLGNDTTLCGCITLSPGYFPGAVIQWCYGPDYPSIKVCKSGTYCVEVRENNCIAHDTIVVTIVSPPIVKLGNDTIVVGSLVLNAENTGSSFVWSTGATTQTITVTTFGKYFVTVTDINGCKASDTINVDISVGVSQYSLNNFPVSIYPNPSNDKTFNINFENPEKGNVEIRIINTLGRVVYTTSLQNFKGNYHNTITLENLAKGIYFVEVIRNTDRNISKLIID